MSWVTVYKFAWGLLAVIAIVALICLFLPKVYHFQDLQKKRDELRKLNAEKQAMIRDRQQKQEKFRSDPAFVERTAREMGMVKPNETIFKFTNGPAATETNAPR